MRNPFYKFYTCEDVRELAEACRYVARARLEAGDHARGRELFNNAKAWDNILHTFGQKS